jgi:hypothetical protein
MLLQMTRTILASFIGNPHLHKLYAKNLNNAYNELEELLARIAVELDMRQVVETMGR